MFKADRVYSQLSASKGYIEWFFSAREGEMGPYPTAEVARRKLAEFVRRRMESGEDGGRSGEIRFKLALVPIDDRPKPLVRLPNK